MSDFPEDVAIDYGPEEDAKRKAWAEEMKVIEARIHDAVSRSLAATNHAEIEEYISALKEHVHERCDKIHAEVTRRELVMPVRIRVGGVDMEPKGEP